MHLNVSKLFLKSISEVSKSFTQKLSKTAALQPFSLICFLLEICTRNPPPGKKFALETSSPLWQKTEAKNGLEKHWTRTN